MPALPLPLWRLGSSPLSVVGHADPEHVYCLRIVTATELPLDAAGLGVHALVRLDECEVDTNAREGTDLGGAIDASGHALDLPYWRVDFDRGLYLPRGVSGAILLEGGDPTYQEPVQVVWRRHQLDPSQSPQPLSLTYAAAAALLPISLQGPAADVRGATSVESPLGGNVTVAYSATHSVAAALAPGVPFSLAGATLVTPASVQPLVFRIVI